MELCILLGIKYKCSKWFRLLSVIITPYNQRSWGQQEGQQVTWPLSGRLSLNGVHAKQLATSDFSFQLLSVLTVIRCDYINQKCSERRGRSSENRTKINTEIEKNPSTHFAFFSVISSQGCYWSYYLKPSYGVPRDQTRLPPYSKAIHCHRATVEVKERMFNITLAKTYTSVYTVVFYTVLFKFFPEDELLYMHVISLRDNFTQNAFEGFATWRKHL